MTRRIIALFSGALFPGTLFLGLVLAVALPAPVLWAEQQLHALGPHSGRPLPRFVSQRHSKANMRRGPDYTFDTDWVLQHRGQPLQVVAEYDVWRRVRTRDGVGGWVHVSQLSSRRTVLVLDDRTALRARPEPRAPVRALAEAGAILTLQSCDPVWCRVSHDRLRGWVPRMAVWGSDSDLDPE